MGADYGHFPLAAHRGESYIAPENTMASFALAWKNNDDAIELDIHLTKDNQVVVCHDADTKRTGGGTALKIRDHTLAEIQKVDVGAFKGPEWAGQACPTLEQVYAAMPTGKKCYTEIKSGIDVVPQFVQIARRSGKAPDQIIVISFHSDALAASKQALPEYKHLLLWAYHQDRKTKQYDAHPNVDDFIAKAKEIGADGLDLQAQDPLDEAACRKIRGAGLELHVWTVDDPAVARRYIDWGAQSITTNRAHWLREQLAAGTEK